jgi:hypothetical protein
MAACSSQAGIRDQFEKSVRAYNRMLRWQEVENAGITYIEPRLNDDFQKQAEFLKKRGTTITDFRIITTQYYQEKKTGDVVAEFDYYILPSNRIKTITYHQEWFFQEDIKNWKLRSGLPLFE